MSLADGEQALDFPYGGPGISEPYYEVSTSLTAGQPHVALFSVR